MVGGQWGKEIDEPSEVLPASLDTARGRCLGPAPVPGQQRVSALARVLGYPLALPTLTSPLSWQDQYQLCYRAALEYLGSFDHYAT